MAARGTSLGGAAAGASMGSSTVSCTGSYAGGSAANLRAFVKDPPREAPPYTTGIQSTGLMRDSFRSCHVPPRQPPDRAAPLDLVPGGEPQPSDRFSATSSPPTSPCSQSFAAARVHAAPAPPTRSTCKWAEAASRAAAKGEGGGFEEQYLLVRRRAKRARHRRFLSVSPR